MTIAGFDHAAIPTDEPARLIAFYRALGFIIRGEEAFNAGDQPYFSIVFGPNKINVHGPRLWRNEQFTLRAPAAKPGCGDFCFVWEGTSEALQAALESAGAPIEVGPVEREGGRGGGAQPGTSIYTRDPDGNLLEFISYAASP